MSQELKRLCDSCTLIILTNHNNPFKVLFSLCFMVILGKDVNKDREFQKFQYSEAYGALKRAVISAKSGDYSNMEYQFTNFASFRKETGLPVSSKMFDRLKEITFNSALERFASKAIDSLRADFNVYGLVKLPALTIKEALIRAFDEKYSSKK